MPVTYVKKEDESSTRSVTVTFRLDPRTRYLAEIAARKQRRSLSSFIEWAIHETLGKVTLVNAEGGKVGQAPGRRDAPQNRAGATCVLLPREERR